MNNIIGLNNTNIGIKEANEFTDRIGIIYPGQSYYLSAPSLFYLQPIFINNKMQYFGIDTRYGDNSEYLISDSMTKTKWIETDSELIGECIKKKTNEFNQKIYIGKSLGTAHLYNQIRQKYINKNDIVIFQTPIMPYTELQELLIEKEIKSFIVYGTNDYTIKKQNFSRISSKGIVKVLEIENAGHNFEEETKVDKSIENLKEVMLGIELFIGSNLKWIQDL